MPVDLPFSKFWFLPLDTGFGVAFSAIPSVCSSFPSAAAGEYSEEKQCGRGGFVSSDTSRSQSLIVGRPGRGSAEAETETREEHGLVAFSMAHA